MRHPLHTENPTEHDASTAFSPYFTWLPFQYYGLSGNKVHISGATSEGSILYSKILQLVSCY